MRDVEVEQESDLVAAQLQIGDQLCGVQRQQFFNGFDFDDDAVFEQEVDSIAGVESYAAVHDRQTNLVLKLYAARHELMAETSAVRTFQQPGSERAVNLHRGFDDALRDGSVKHMDFAS